MKVCQTILAIFLVIAIFHLKTTANAQSQTGSLTFTDSQILDIVKTTNDTEIAAARLAIQKTKNTEVKQFANMMMDMHSKLNDNAAILANRNQLNFQPTDASKKISLDGQMALKTLQKTINAADFDRAYINQQVVAHQEVLNDLNTRLIPAAQTADLKNLLQTTKTDVQAHLTKAMEVRSKLNF